MKNVCKDPEIYHGMLKRSLCPQSRKQKIIENQTLGTIEIRVLIKKWDSVVKNMDMLTSWLTLRTCILKISLEVLN